MSDKKVVYIYLKYDPRNVGKFPLGLLLADIFREQKAVAVSLPDHYPTSPEQLLSVVRSYTTQIYYTANDLISQYTADYHMRVATAGRL